MPKFRLLTMMIMSLLFGTHLSFASPVLPAIPGDKLKLGLVDFPVSTHSPLAKAHFLQGLKYLHNFMYPLAFREFQLAQHQDPDFALSYWGMAMCYKWELWSYENKVKARHVLEKLTTVKHPEATPVEQGLINAVATVFAPENAMDADKKYMEAMRKLYLQFPNNPDVASFYVLSIIAYNSVASSSEQSKKTAMNEARQILERLLPLYPAHPGLVHYSFHVHEMDDPDCLKSALLVSRNVETYLTDSSHLLHMPAHLYTVLGQWKNSAKMNSLSVQASRHMCDFLNREHIDLKPMDKVDIDHVDSDQKSAPWTQKQREACDADNVYHSLEWLHYAYLQLNEFDKANALLNEMRAVYAIEEESMYAFWVYRMQARQIIYSKHFDALSTISAPLVETSDDKAWAAYSECGMLLADGLRAIHHQQSSFYAPVTERFQTIINEMAAPANKTFQNVCRLNLIEFNAMKAVTIEKDWARAVRLLEDGYSIQQALQAKNKSFMLPFVPLQELYGVVLLQHPTKENIAKAIKLYQNELIFYPDRPQALQGLRHAGSH